MILNAQSDKYQPSSSLSNSRQRTLKALMNFRAERISKEISGNPPERIYWLQGKYPLKFGALHQCISQK
jgi:hypothetical protein